MLEYIDSLPRPQSHPAANDRDREIGLGQRGSDVRGHVIRAFGVMAITGIVLGSEPLKEIGKIQSYIGIGVLLDHQRGGSVLNEQGEQTLGDFGGCEPSRYIASERIEALASSPYLELMNQEGFPIRR